MIASLSEHIQALTAAGDLAAAKVAAEALVNLLGLAVARGASAGAP